MLKKVLVFEKTDTFRFFISNLFQTIKKALNLRAFKNYALTLTSFQLRVLFVNHINATFTANNFTIFIAFFFRF